jgi:hypothetical protein
MKPEDVEVKIFGSFVHWLYTRDPQPPRSQEWSLVDWAKLCSLAGRFMANAFSNLAAVQVNCAEPDDVPGSGNTLEEFQHFAYSTHGNEILRSKAAVKPEKFLND